MARQDFGGPIRPVIPGVSARHVMGRGTPGEWIWAGCESYCAESDYRQVVSDTGHMSIVYVEAGEGTFVDVRGAPHGFKGGQTFVRYPEGTHEMHLSAGMQLATWWVSIPNPLYALLCMTEVIPIWKPSVLDGAAHGVRQRFKGIIELVRDKPVGAIAKAVLLAHGLVADLYRWHEVAQEPSDEARMVQQLCRRLEEGAEERTALEDLARDFRCSYSKVRKVFRGRLGVPPGAYRIQWRIGRAKEALCDATIPIKEVAFMLGYTEVASFTRQFRRETGMTPGQYRQAQETPG